MKKVLFVLLGVSLLIAGCAYFNTFYNAKQYYKKAYTETKKNFTDKPGTTEKKYYEEAITRALTLMVDYPNSKYVDDALLLAGKAYYYRQEYFMAKRKFLELLSNYPESPFVDEARLWMARTQLALDEFEEAEALVNTLVSEDVSKRIQGQAYYYLGKFHERKRHFDQAVQAFQNALKYGLEDQLANTLYAMGTSLDTLGRYKEAGDAFDRVPKATALKELEFEARFRHAQMLKKLGKIDEALSEFQTLLADEENTKRIPDIKLQIADSYFREGNADDAIDAYDEITQLHEKTEQSAEAYYRIGQIYEKSKIDYEKALDNYLQVEMASSRSVYADTAKIYTRDIQRLQALEHIVNLGKKGETGDALLVKSDDLKEDSLTIDLVYDIMDTTTGDTACYHVLFRIGGKIFADSVFIEKNKTLDQRQRDLDLNMGMEKQVTVDWRKWVEENEMPSFSNLETEFKRLEKRRKLLEKPEMADNPELSTFRVDELDRNLFLLAELYLFRFEKPDSAFNHYDYLIREFPDCPYTPKALYNMAHLYEAYYNNPEQVSLMYRTLIDEYGNTLYANAARKTLGEAPVPTQKDTITSLFASAESALFDEKQPEKALDFYNQIWSRFHETDVAPKVIYAKGYVYENYLHSPDQAYAIYDSLISLYPESPFSRRVRPKLDAVKSHLASAEKTVMHEGQSEIVPDSSEIVTMNIQKDSESEDEELTLAGDITPDETDGISDMPENRSSMRRDRPQANSPAIRLDVMARLRKQLRSLQMEQTPTK